MQKKKSTQGRGISLRDPNAHAADHRNYGRRSFLRTLGLAGAASAAATSLPVSSLYGFPLAQALSESFSDRKLVLIRLKGGNDGLNTIVPLYGLEQYQNLRPTLAHAESDLIDLNGSFGVPTAMQPLMNLWTNDRMRVLNSVGYPDHSLSHFTGADIMDSGSSNIAENGDGWLARHYVAENPDYRENPSSSPPAVKIGGPASILFNDADKIDISANFPTAEGLEELAESGTLYDNLTAPDDCYYGEQVLFLRTIANAASLYSVSISDAYANSTTDAEYTSSLGDQLKLVARLIKGDLGTQLYLVTLDGFDTHVSQNGTGNHLGLLEDLSLAVNAFYEDLAAHDREEEVLAITYSEFGRRVEENGFGGTDHGQALPVMLFGPALGGSGTHGTNPDLTNLDANGNLQFGTDFRSIYATLLESWLCVDSGTVDAILGNNYPRLPELGLVCDIVSTKEVDAKTDSLRHLLIPNGGRSYSLEIQLPRSTRFSVELITLSGHRLKRLPPRLYPSGTHRIPFTLSELGTEIVPIAYVIDTGSRRYSGKFMASK